MVESSFRFKQFTIAQDKCTMKVNTDGILLAAWSDLMDVKNVLDIGSGTGIIAIMIAQRSPIVFATGIEIELDAFTQAKENMSNCPFSDRLLAKHIAVQDYTSEAIGGYDLIISNPPFFSGGTFSSNENKANVRHTIKLSHADLLRSVNKLLASLGKFDVILPYLEGLRLIEIATHYDLYVSRLVEVKSRPTKTIERLLIRFEKTKKELKKDLLIIHEDDQSNLYSTQFKGITKDFYLDM
jgi:tRNA1Val (adenine37-N6)-methyltransferase